MSSSRHELQPGEELSVHLAGLAIDRGMIKGEGSGLKYVQDGDLTARATPSCTCCSTRPANGKV
jgi:hypothetical protein